jgi:hypothetical protein
VDLYKIGVEIVLAGGIAQALAGVAGQMTGLHGQVGNINAAFGDWKVTLGLVAGAAGIGLMVVGLEKVFEKTKELNSALTELKTMGATADELSAIHEQFLGGANIPGMTEARFSGIYASIRDMFIKTKPEEISKVMPDLAKLQQVMVNEGLLHGKTAESSEDDLRSIIRAEDLMGQFSDKEGNLDTGKFRNFMDFATRTYIGTHGQIGPRELLNVGKQGGIALSELDQDGLYAAAVVAQQMGGARFGTAQMSLFQQFAGGTMSSNKARALTDLGILNQNDWEKSGGGVIVHQSGKDKLQEVLGTGDPIKFADALKKAMVEAGVTQAI